MTATVLIEPEHAAAFILSEGHNRYSRDVVTVGASQTLSAGQVIGKVDYRGSLAA